MKVSIVGFGRFGKTLYQLLKNDFNIILYQRSKIQNYQFSKNTIIAKEISEIYKSDAVFYAVPISQFEKVISKHKKYFKKGNLLIDVLSVKMHPAKIFKKHVLSTGIQAILTHPMFGPDSSKNGFEGLPMIMDKFMADEKNYKFWKNYFLSKKLKVIEMSSKEHDKMAATSQGLTHFMGRLLDLCFFQETQIDSLGAKKMQEVKEQTCNDTWQLFADLQHFNPFTKKMRLKLGQSYDSIYNKLLPKRVNRNFITFGIQGGKGSFNEEAIKDYIEKKKIKKYKIKYLYTSEKVLKNLHEGNIDYGLFATQNATGGIVGESVYAMAKYKFKIIFEFDILIRHFLMKRKEIPLENIIAVMAHSQNFRQCKATLLRKHPNLQQRTGEGDLMDTARAAMALKNGKIPSNTAILGPKVLSTIYDLEIIDEDLQDKKDNLTSFLLVSR